MENTLQLKRGSVGAGEKDPLCFHGQCPYSSQILAQT
jgi:hypothetical protein